MRPALFRLLKRPSALSMLDALQTSPLGIEQLDFGFKSTCLRCQSQSTQQVNAIPSTELEQTAKDSLPSPSTGPPFSLRVYEIESSLDKTQPRNRTANESHADKSPINLKRLGLQPDKLEFESDVGHTYDFGTRLVDVPKYRDNFSIWEELLRYRQRRYGVIGTLHIWKGLMTRVGDIQLPVDGEHADFLWRSFVELGFTREPVMEELANYALKLWDNTGNRWNMLYQSVVGGFIERGMIRQAVGWHKRLQTPHLYSPDQVVKLLKIVRSLNGEQGDATTSSPLSFKQRSTPPALFAFREICKSTNCQQIYAPVISALVEDRDFAEAFRMHKLLVNKGDHPQSYEDLHALIEHAKEYGPSNLYEKLHRYASGRFGKKVKINCSNNLTQRNQSVEPTEVWLEEKQFKDDFGARVFATRALNFDMILSGLKMFGVPAIGPQSLREMAVRARGSQDIMEKLGYLEKEGISVGKSLFARLLRKLAAENREILVSDLLHSDQHPDVLEDVRLQETLLVSYYIARDWRPYNLTLAILVEIYGEGPELPNIHFRKYIAAGELVLASKVVDEMVMRNTILTNESIDFMIEHALRLRKPGAGPALGGKFNPKAEVTFVCRILQRIVPMGAHVSTRLWVEMIKRLGITDNWEELRTCCLWLSRHYSPSWTNSQTIASSTSNQPQRARTTISRPASEQILRTIFTQQMQAAIVSWGFKIQPPSKLKTYPTISVQNEKLVPYVRGLVLLRELEGNGINLHFKWIRRACRQRLTVLFGRPRHSNRRMNRELRRSNPYNLEKVTADIDCAWGDKSPPLVGDGVIKDSPTFLGVPVS